MFGKRTFFFLHLLAASWGPGRDARRCVSKNHQSSQKIINRLKKSSIVSKNHQSPQKIINRLKKSSIVSKNHQAPQKSSNASKNIKRLKIIRCLKNIKYLKNHQVSQKTTNASILNLNLFISEKFILFPIQRIVFYVINNPLIILVPLNNTVVKPGLPAKTGIYF